MASATIIDSPHRTFPRIQLYLPLSWECEGAHDTAEMLDLSAEGAFMRPTYVSPGAFETGNRLQLSFVLPNGSVVQTAATVRWSGLSRAHGCTGIGVQFERPSPDVERWIDTRN